MPRNSNSVNLWTVAVSAMRLGLRCDCHIGSDRNPWGNSITQAMLQKIVGRRLCYLEQRKLPFRTRIAHRCLLCYSVGSLSWHFQPSSSIYAVPEIWATSVDRQVPASGDGILHSAGRYRNRASIVF